MDMTCNLSAPLDCYNEKPSATSSLLNLTSTFLPAGAQRAQEGFNRWLIFVIRLALPKRPPPSDYFEERDSKNEHAGEARLREERSGG